MRQPKTLMVPLLAVLLIAAGYAGWQRWSHHTVAQKPEASAPLQLNAHVLRYGPGAPQLNYLKVQPAVEVARPVLAPLNGRLVYDEDHTVRVSSPVAGRVVRIAAEPGDAVRSSQPLVWLNAPDYAAAVADLRKAGADHTQKTLAWERARTLYSGGVAPRKDLEAAQADLRQSEAELARTRAHYRNLNQAGVVNDQFVLRAPLTGVVADRHLNPGSEVRPDQADPLFVITDPTHLWALADLPEQDLGKLHVGQAVVVEVDAYPGEPFPARVVHVADVLDPNTRRIQVRCVLDNPRRLLKPEMFARITPLTGAEKAIRVPTSALMTQGMYNYVFVETQPGTLEKRRVAVTMQARDYSYLSQGIHPGDRIVTAGVLLLNSELGGGA